METIVLPGALWLAALVVLVAGAKLPGSRFSKVRWLAIGFLLDVRAQLLSSIALHHNWPHQQAIIANEIGGIGLLAWVVCFVMFCITGLRREPKRQM